MVPSVTGMILIDSLLAGDMSVFKNAVSHIILPAGLLAYYSLAYISANRVEPMGAVPVKTQPLQLSGFTRTVTLDWRKHWMILTNRFNGCWKRITRPNNWNRLFSVSSAASTNPAHPLAKPNRHSTTVYLVAAHSSAANSVSVYCRYHWMI